MENLNAWKDEENKTKLLAAFILGTLFFWVPGYVCDVADAFVGPSLVPRPSLRETTSGLPILCCCCNTKCSWSSSGIKTVFIEPSILFESSVLPDMVSEVG